MGSSAPSRELSLFDAVCLIVGIIIGVGIYQMAPDVAKGVSGWPAVLALWAAGGFLSLCGALGYAELATAYPRAGGDYVYLGRAYGRWAGFLFGWIQLTIVRPGDIAVMAFAFALYARAIYDPWAPSGCAQVVYAVAITVILTCVNVLGVRQGKRTQNVLTIIKVCGLLAVIVVAALAPAAPPVSTASTASMPVSLALIFVLFTFGGWNELAYVAAEVRHPHRNIVRALVWGTLSVTVLYLLLNGAFLRALGHAGMAGSDAVAADTVAVWFPRFGSRAISVLICLSALGAINGLIFTGARISYALGRDHRLFRALGRWDEGRGTPTRALLVQGGIAVLLIICLGSFVDTLVYTAPAVYSFYLATSLAVIVLRKREPDIERPYKVTGYPVPTLLFSLVCGLLIYSAAAYRPGLALASLGVLLTGIPVYLLDRRPPRRRKPRA